VDLFFTGANEVYWKVRFEPGVQSGVQDRTMVNYKSTQSGPADPSGIPTGTWRDPAGANAPENALTGLMYIGQKNFDYFPLRVSAAEGKDRIWRYTGLENQPTGTATNIGAAIVGWEWDARVANGQEPAGVTTLASSPVDGDILQDAGRVYAAGNAVSHMTKYTAPSGALVVGTGTNHWNWGLALNADGEGEPERRIQQATTNILIDMGALPQTPAGDLVSVGERAGTPDRVPPVISRLRVTNRVFAARRARRSAVKRGTRFRFRLSEAARVAITIQRRTTGKRHDGRCVRRTALPQDRPNCIRFVKRGRVIRFAGKAGANRRAFSGRFGRRALKAGRYRARVAATDMAGNRSRPKTVRFHIRRP
jgi:hypothetical protein